MNYRSCLRRVLFPRGKPSECHPGKQTRKATPIGEKAAAKIILINLRCPTLLTIVGTKMSFLLMFSKEKMDFKIFEKKGS